MKKHLLLIGALLFPTIIVLYALIQNNLTFWYDPARDLLAAWDNLSKPTLIGPTSGIPGIFYGPYWIWLLSFGLIFSKNPIMVTFITATIPYLVLLPLFWFHLSKFFDRTSLIIGWLLFMLSTGITYATGLWNPYPAPLITIILFYLLLISRLETFSRKSFLTMLLAGFLLGLVVTFHLSFGIALILGISIFYFCESLLAILQSKSKLKIATLKIRLFYLMALISGFIISFIPSLLFEMRHAFLQTQTLLHTFFKFGAVVAVNGLNQSEIANAFLQRLSVLLHVPTFIAGILLLFLIVAVFYNQFKNNAKSTHFDRTFLLSFSVIIGIALLYFTVKNPIWPYHFIGVEVPFLFLVVYVSSKFSLVRKALSVWTIIVILISSYSFLHSMNHKTPYFTQQEEVVNTIAKDAHGKEYTVYAYSSSIYIYEYSYFFRWLTNKNVPYDPGLTKQSSNIVYLILPQKQNSLVKDFIHYRTPENRYKNMKIWHTSGGITITKNEATSSK